MNKQKPVWKSRLQDHYNRYVENYKSYLKLRGYGDHVNDCFFARRAFLTCWLEPGFHRFWQVWNPGISYFTYRLYLYLGGKNNRDLWALMVFIVNGLVHNIVFNIFVCRWSDFPLPFTFFSFGILAVTSRRIEKTVRMEKWPVLLHLVINIGLVIASFNFGFYINNLLRIWRQK